MSHSPGEPFEKAVLPLHSEMPKALVMDDDSAHRDNFALVAELLGYQVVAKAVHGQDGVEKLKQNPDVKLVIADFDMPTNDGTSPLNGASAVLQMRQHIESIGGTQPFIVVASSQIDADWGRVSKLCMKAGANMVSREKGPFALKTALEAELKKHTPTPEVGPAAAPPPP